MEALFLWSEAKETTYVNYLIANMINGGSFIIDWKVNFERRKLYPLSIGNIILLNRTSCFAKRQLHCTSNLSKFCIDCFKRHGHQDSQILRINKRHFY